MPVPAPLTPPLVPAPRRFDPATLSTVDPVAAPFTRPATLIVARSPEYALDRLPTRPPKLIKLRRLRPTDAPTRHRKAVCDIHDVSSLPDPAPARTCPVPCASPIPLPYTVTADDPVPAMLPRRTPLIAPAPKDTARLRLITCSPTVIPTRPLLVQPCPTRAARLVSDAHFVPAIAVPPVVADIELALRPIPAPNNVTTAEPVAAPLRLPSALAVALSQLIARVMLPTPTPTVDQVRRLRSTPDAPLHRMLLSLCHSVTSHAVRPLALAPDTPVTPMLIPLTVRLAAPVTPPLLCCAALILPAKTE